MSVAIYHPSLSCLQIGFQLRTLLGFRARSLELTHGRVYQSKGGFCLRDFCRMAAKIHPALVHTTPTVTMTVTTTTKAMTAGIVASVAEGRLPWVNVHFNFAGSSHARYQSADADKPTCSHPPG